MNGALLLIVRKSLRQHLFSSGVTMLSVALAAGLVMAVFSIQRQAREAFAGGDPGFDAVLGARGSQLQLVLNTVFHLETSPGNIPWSLYTEMRDAPGVSLAIPYATGDNYRGFRIVGTTEDLFSQVTFRGGRHFAVAPGGRIFEPGFREAVLGSHAAQATGLKPGDIIHPAHGVDESETAVHPEDYVVVGVLEPTNTPSDRVVWIPIEGIFRMEGHVLRGTGEVFEAAPGEAIPDAHKEISAVMLKLASPTFGWQLEQRINKQGKEATLAFPIGAVMLDLFEKLGWAHRVLALVAYLVVVVSAAAILASIYNTIQERRREFAILRALGGHRNTIFGAIVLEAGAIAFFGSLAGLAVQVLILTCAAWVIRAQTGVVLDVFSLHPAQYLVPLAMTLLGMLSGLIPAWRAYRTDVAEHLSPQT